MKKLDSEDELKEDIMPDITIKCAIDSDEGTAESAKSLSANDNVITAMINNPQPLLPTAESLAVPAQQIIEWQTADNMICENSIPEGDERVEVVTRESLKQLVSDGKAYINPNRRWGSASRSHIIKNRNRGIAPVNMAEMMEKFMKDDGSTVGDDGRYQ